LEDDKRFHLIGMIITLGHQVQMGFVKIFKRIILKSGARQASKEWTG
jgi:hypothetical protein